MSPRRAALWATVAIVPALLGTALAVWDVLRLLRRRRRTGRMY